MSRLIFTRSPNEAKNLAREVAKGKIRRLYRGVYTEDLESSETELVRQNWLNLTSFFVPSGVLSYRTALELKPYEDIIRNKLVVFVCSTYTKIINRGVLELRVVKGDNKNYLDQVIPSLKRSNFPRAVLENLVSSRNRTGPNRNIEFTEIESHLLGIFRAGGEKALNEVRDEARLVSSSLGYEQAFLKLNKLISALFLTNEEIDSLSTKPTMSSSKKNGFDLERVDMFNKLALYLKKYNFIDRKYEFNSRSWRSISFFEAYFSNYIEGTRFQIDEAEDIVFQNKLIVNRQQDSHDVKEVFNIVSDFSDMTETPIDFHNFLFLLKRRHAAFMGKRKDKIPGEFKTVNNQAGSTLFVSTENVEGTLEKGFQIYETVNKGLPKALFMMFLVSEVHPFSDGNGRLARIMMNSELAARDIFKCIVPTAHRENYLNGLRRASRECDFSLYCKVMDQAHAYSAMIDWEDYGGARLKLEKDAANLEPDSGLPILNRVFRELNLSDTFL